MSDYTFANALLATKSASLLSNHQFRELKSTDDAMYLLKLQSFGYAPGEKEQNVDEVVKNEVIKLKEELMSILPNDDLPLFFFTKYDLTNIRSFFKNKFLRTEIESFEDAGYLTYKDLELSILKDNYYGVMAPYKELFSHFFQSSYEDSFTLVNEIQRVFQGLLSEAISKRKDIVLKTYFVISTDINNLLTLLRINKMQMDIVILENNLLDYGSIPVKEIALLHNASSRDIITRYSSLYLTRFVEPLEHYFSDGDFVKLEHALLKILLEELEPYQVDIKSTASIIAYVVRKQIEIVDIRRLYFDRKASLMVGS